MKKFIFISDEQKIDLKKLANGRTVARQLAQRASIVLLSEQGLGSRTVANKLDLSRSTVLNWRERWASCGHSGLPVSEILKDKERAGAPASFTAEQICQLVAMACQKPSDFNRPISHWSSRELAEELVIQNVVSNISPKHVARLLSEGKIKPHLMNYYLHTEKDENFDKKVSDICELYRQAPAITEQGGKVISCDEMTGIQALERVAPDKLVEPGRVERHEFNYTRHGTLCLIANFDVGTGKVLHPTIGPTRTEQDFVNHIAGLIMKNPSTINWHFVLDNLNIHQSESLVKFVAEKNGINLDTLGEKGKDGILKTQKSRQQFLNDSDHSIVFHYTPKHASWMNQVEIWFSILVRKLLKRESFISTENLKKKILAFISYFNATMAKPFKWTYRGRALA